MAVTAIAIDREALDVRSSGDQRRRVDAYFVEFECTPDRDNPGAENHTWICRFEVARGTPFKLPGSFLNKDEVHAIKGWKL